jgi:hypothetical protein
MRRPLRIMRIVGLALLCAGLLGAWSMRAWAYAPLRPKEPPPGQGSSHPKPPKPPEEPKVRPLPKPPKEPKVRLRPKEPKVRGRRKAPPPPPPATVAPPPVPPAPILPHAGSTEKSHVTGVRRASARSTASTAARNAARYRSLGAGSSQPLPALKLAHLAVSRAWISRSGPRAQRRTTFVFRLSRGTVVEFVVVRVAPDCRVVGRFRVKGRAGLNRVQFRGRIGRRILRPGTYRVTARTLPSHGAKPVGVPLVIVRRPNPLRSEIVADRAANACATSGETTKFSAAVQSAASPKTPQGPRSSGRKLSLPRIGGVLAEQFHKSIDAVKAVPPFLFFVLALAIALLALAATPRKTSPSARLEVLLAYRRGLIAIAGTTMFLGVVITYAVS